MRWRRWALALAGIWLVFGAALLAIAALQLQRGVREVDAVRGGISGQDLASGRPIPILHRAGADFAAAHRAAASPVLLPLRVVPVLGRQLRSVIALSAAAQQVALTGELALRDADVILAERTPQQRLAVLHKMSDVANAASTRLRRVDLGPSRGLFGPLARRRDAFDRDLTKVRTGLDRAEGATSGLTSLLDGDHTYLLLAANNAEMRTGSGTFLSVGLLTASNGRLEMGGIRPAAELALPGEGVPLSGDFADRWGFLHPNREWRNLGVSPNFPTTAALASRMWVATGGQQPDGVIALDVEALKAVLEATGPVPNPDGGQVDASGVEQFVFHDQYIGVATDEASQRARSDRLGSLASAALRSADSGDTSLSELGADLARAASGRHILLWSPDSAVEASWQRAAVDGGVGPNDLAVGIVNRGANKLDPYLQVSASLGMGPPSHGQRPVTLQLQLRNTAPADEPAYVAGLEPAAVGVPPGDYTGLVVVYLPRWAGDEAFADRSAQVVSGPEGNSWVMAARVVVPRTQQVVVTLGFAVGGDHGAMDLLPSARVPPGAWNARGFGEGSGFDDSGKHLLVW